MNTQKIYTGHEMSAASVRAFGHYALLAPHVINMALEYLIVTRWSLPFNFCEHENGIGYFIPSAQGKFAAGFDAEGKTIEINETDLGLMVTLMYLNHVINTDTSEFSAAKNPAAQDDKNTLREKYVQLKKYARENMSEVARYLTF
ncbi:hypothetical protein ACFH4J_003406 [Escherichia coli]|uniref:hypothetical protein n=1 Tax=Enterobacter hormaechei TaxID=158836 RepID=UPI0027D2E441|nr:hypothetical protein [Enterobacter hormaechei]WLZ51933.1 hypothetical protein QPR65_22635 [Enterobacter hormaechei]